MVAATPPAPHTNTNEENQEQYGGGEEPAGRQPQDRTGQSRRSCLGNALDHWVHSVVLPNGSRLSCGRLARRRKGSGRQSVPRQGHNTPLPLKRSPPASFKRLLGGTHHPKTIQGTRLEQRKRDHDS